MATRPGSPVGRGPIDDDARIGRLAGQRTTETAGQGRRRTAPARPHAALGQRLAIPDGQVGGVTEQESAVAASGSSSSRSDAASSAWVVMVLQLL